MTAVGLAPEDVAISEARLEELVSQARSLLSEGQASEARELLARAYDGLAGRPLPVQRLRIVHHLARAETDLARHGSPRVVPREIDYERARDLVQSIATLYRGHGDLSLLLERDLLWAQIDRYQRPDWAEACLRRAIRTAEGVGWTVAAAWARLDLIERLELEDRAPEAADERAALKRAALASESVRAQISKLHRETSLQLSVAGIAEREGPELRTRLEVLHRLAGALTAELSQKPRESQPIWQRIRTYRKRGHGRDGGGGE